jgi:hypothetical protein
MSSIGNEVLDTARSNIDSICASDVDLATQALLKRKYKAAMDLAVKGLHSIPRSALSLDSHNMCGKISLRHTTCGKYGRDAVSFAVIYIQAWFELENRVAHIRTATELEEFEQAIIFIPLYYLHHLRSAMPFLVSVVWLKSILALGKLQEGKKEILNYLQTAEARLYMQGHWEAVLKREGPITADSSITLSPKARYGELIEILCLNILIPLGEKSVALSYLSTDVSIGDKKKLAIYKTIQNMPEIKPRKVYSSAPTLKRKKNEDNNIETKHGETNDEVKRPLAEEELLEDEPISDEDVKILVLSVVGVGIVAGVGYFAYRRRRNFLDSVSYGIRQFTRLLAGKQGGGIL